MYVCVLVTKKSHHVLCVLFRVTLHSYVVTTCSVCECSFFFFRLFCSPHHVGQTSSARTRRRHDARRPERRATEVRHARVSSDEPAAKRSLGGLFPRRTARRASVSPSRFVPVVPLGTALTRSPSDHRAFRVLERLQSSDVEIDEAHRAHHHGGRGRRVLGNHRARDANYYILF